MLTKETTQCVLCATFKQFDDSISTVVHVLLYLLQLNDDDVTGELVANKEVFPMMKFDEESIVRFTDLLLIVDVTEHRFAKVLLVCF